MKTPKTWVVIPAAGVGRRMGGPVAKQYLPLMGKPILQHSIERMASMRSVAAVMVVVGPEDDWWPDIAAKLQTSMGDRLLSTLGGAERCDSVLNGLRALTADTNDWVLVHDAARPCVDQCSLDRLVQAAATSPEGCILAVPVRDTMKRSGADGLIRQTVSRELLWHALTPQMFQYGQLINALEQAVQQGAVVTDEASAMEFSGFSPRLIEGSEANIKITKPGDLELAEFYMTQQMEENQC